MATSQTELIILFADIARSTRLYDALGNETAQQLIASSLAELSGVAVRHHGTVIKTIGDEVMCSFRQAKHALEAARSMHETLDMILHGAEDPGVSLDLHVGIHKGPVIEKEEDVFGDAVNVAARLVRISKPRQTLLTKDTIDGLNGFDNALIRSLGRIPVRGKAEALSVFEMIWEEQDATIITTQSLSVPVETISMELRIGDITLEAGPSRPCITIGRDKGNDLSIPGNHVSRSHARIEFQAGKFLLSDQSSNGTFVFFRMGKPVHLRRDMVVLYGTGTISVGIKANSYSRDVIHFREMP